MNENSLDSNYFFKIEKISIIQYIDIYLKINKILLTIICWIKQRDY